MLAAMCAHYAPQTDPARLRTYFGVDNIPLELKPSVWPGYQGPLANSRNRPEAETQWGGNNCPLSYLNRTNWRRENCSVVFDKNGFNRVNWANVVPVLTFLF